MTKYIIGEIISLSGANLFKNPSDQTVYRKKFQIKILGSGSFQRKTKEK